MMWRSKRSWSPPADADAGLPGGEQSGVPGYGDAGPGGAGAVPQVQVEAGGGAAYRAPGLLPAVGVAPRQDAALERLDEPGVPGVRGEHAQPGTVGVRAGLVLAPAPEPHAQLVDTVGGEVRLVLRYRSGGT